MKLTCSLKIVIALFYLSGRICFAGSPAFFDKGRFNRHIAPPNQQQERITFKIATLEFDKRQPAKLFNNKQHHAYHPFEIACVRRFLINDEVVTFSYHGNYIDPPKLRLC